MRTDVGESTLMGLWMFFNKYTFRRVGLNFDRDMSVAHRHYRVLTKAIQGGPKVTANGMHMLTFLILKVQQKRGVENARKSRPNLGKKFNFNFFIGLDVAPGRPGSRFSLMENPMLNR